VLDAASQLDLIRNLPGLELDEEVNEQSLKVLGQLVGNVVERFVCAVKEGVANQLKALDHLLRSVKKGLCQRAHILKDVRWTVDDHEGRVEDPHIDVFRLTNPGNRAMAKGAEVMDALKAGLGSTND